MQLLCFPRLPLKLIGMYATDLKDLQPFSLPPSMTFATRYDRSTRQKLQTRTSIRTIYLTIVDKIFHSSVNENISIMTKPRCPHVVTRFRQSSNTQCEQTLACTSVSFSDCARDVRCCIISSGALWFDVFKTIVNSLNNINYFRSNTMCKFWLF